ncbi:MAG: MBOAT family O-acyltransferase [Phycisphaeraceae bacterium]
MVFSSHLFVFYFLPLALALYYALPWRRGRHLMLTGLSYLFYGWANPAFVLLMLFSTAVDYIAGLVIARRLTDWRRPIETLTPGTARSGAQKWAVAVSVVTNLGLLGFFKYFNFGVDSYNGLLQMLGLEAAQWQTTLRVVLPLGISFYTFQSMSYTIDIYRGEARAMRHPIDFACYVSMFPQLVAGPIIRFQEVDDQLRHRSHTLEKFARGASLMCLGLFKKVALANPCGMVADTCFDARGLGVADAWYGAVAYAMQIYFDFSGYSDMAIGLGLMLGFVFPKNFDSPYRSRSITEFWRRWHISLSTWLRDYLYIPLGGNRKGPARTYVNLLLVMVLGGLWHGAAWTFVVWGAIHGGWLAFERMQGKGSFYRHLPGAAQVVLTFVVVLVAWVFFRAEDLPHALSYLGAMLALAEPTAGAALVAGVIHDPYYVVMVSAAVAVAFFAPQSWDWTRAITPAKAAACLALMWAALALLEAQSYNPFIYFIF